MSVPEQNQQPQMPQVPIHESYTVLVPVCLAALATCYASSPSSPLLSFSASLTLVTSLHFIIRKLKMDSTKEMDNGSDKANDGNPNTASPATSNTDVALNPDEWRDFPLESVTPVSPDTSIYQFRLPTPHHQLGISVGQHISVRMSDAAGKEISRSYTPISDPDTRGHFRLLVKTYAEGNVSRHIRALAIGAPLSVKGPKGKFLYRTNMARAIGLVAGGTGIAPIYQVIRAVLENSAAKDNTKLSLVYGSRTENDILLRKELDEYAAKHPERFKLQYVLSEVAPDAKWTGGRGFITKDLLKERLEAPSSDVRVLLCGPPPMNKGVLSSLEELGYGAPSKAEGSMVFKF